MVGPVVQERSAQLQGQAQNPLVRAPRRLVIPRTYYAERRGQRAWLQPVRLAQLLVVSALLITCLGTIYYYNQFVNMDQNVHTAMAQIDRELQRRSDLVHSLLPPAFEYAALEREIFTEVARMRTELGGVNAPHVGQAEVPDAPALSAPSLPELGTVSKGEPLAEMLKGLIAVSEQYPDMKASAPFKILMEKIVDVENRLAVERKNYNDQVNIYTTATASFPGRIFARLFNFEDHKLFKADRGAEVLPQVGWPEK